MRAVRALRGQGVPVFFTVDAGPQVKAVCAPEAIEQVRAALAAVPGVLNVVETGLGGGSRIIGEAEYSA
jgi:diphosphomevalonate decarboxylase